MAVKVSPRLYQGGDPEVLRFVEYLRSTGVIKHVDQEDLFSYDGMIAFDRIRATSAWSETRGENEGAIIDMSKISIPISQSLSERIPLAFHMTTMKSLKGIADSGIIPGGRRRNRSCTFFSAFPPRRAQKPVHRQMGLQQSHQPRQRCHEWTIDVGDAVQRAPWSI